MASIGPQDLTCRPCNEMTADPFSLNAAFQVCTDPFTFKDPSIVIIDTESQNNTKPVVNTTMPKPPVPEVSQPSSATGIAVGVSIGLVILIGSVIGGWIFWKKRKVY